MPSLSLEWKCHKTHLSLFPGLLNMEMQLRTWAFYDLMWSWEHEIRKEMQKWIWWSITKALFGQRVRVSISQANVKSILHIAQHIKFSIIPLFPENHPQRYVRIKSENLGTFSISFWPKQNQHNLTWALLEIRKYKKQLSRYAFPFAHLNKRS